MRLSVFFLVPSLLLACLTMAAQAASSQARLAARSGDRSVVLHWGYAGEKLAHHLYKSVSADAPFKPVAMTNADPHFVDFEVENGKAYFYELRPMASGSGAASSARASATPQAFASDDAFLDYVQQTAFDFFWFEANPANGLVRDRNTAASASSIAAVGFGLTGIGIGIDRGWITRAEGRERVLTTLRTFWNGPQGDSKTGTIGHRGWFYHFLDMRSATRTWNCELSTIDTGLFLAGALYAREYFNGDDPQERQIRELAQAIFSRVDWGWMVDETPFLRHGWTPEGGILRSRWEGYNEAMILYILGFGLSEAVPEKCWDSWTSGYQWQTHYGQSYVNFPPLFGHQYSHCWVDFRKRGDSYMRAKGLDYFENSRRATLAQREYCIANPGKFAGYSGDVWGITACDGPGMTIRGLAGYSARGAPPAERDDGTIAPTAVGGSLPFAPEICLPTLRHFYDRYRKELWTPYGFRDAFNLHAKWWGPDVLGIDQGAILLMIENYRSEGVWKVFMRSPEIQRGLKRAGFQTMP